MGPIPRKISTTWGKFGEFILIYMFLIFYTIVNLTADRNEHKDFCIEAK